MGRLSDYPLIQNIALGQMFLAGDDMFVCQTDAGKMVNDFRALGIPLYQGVVNAGKALIVTSDGTVKPQGAAKLIGKTITENGTYIPADDEADGYSYVIVDIGSTGITYTPNPTTGQTITDGLIEKTILQNGIYYANDDNADGYSLVTVNVTQ